jgi:hypothetical protein
MGLLMARGRPRAETTLSGPIRQISVVPCQQLGCGIEQWRTMPVRNSLGVPAWMN